jgi:3-oxoacyl-[acyl-carrier-protein] synthase-1
MVFLSCLSLVCPVGYSVASAAAALRAGIAAFAETGYRDVNGEPIIGAPVEVLPPDLRGRSRLVALIQFALDKIDPRLGNRLPWDRMSIILCSREVDQPGAQLAGIVAELRFPTGATFTGNRAIHVASGAASAIQAVAMARDILAKSDAQACLILAADSLIDARVLVWLERMHRLKTSERTDGVIPGEAACLAVVSKDPITDDCVSVRGLGMANETATILNEEPFRAHGMKAALYEALQETGIAMHDVDFRLSDVAGESYAFEELVLTQTRLMRKVRPSQPLWHAADCIGDCGVAAGLIQFAWAGQAFHRGYAPGPVAALHAASAFGLRAAAVVAAHSWRRL